MTQFQVPPMEQHLICNGDELWDGEKTLSELGVFPGCTILLKVIEMCSNYGMGEVKRCCLRNLLYICKLVYAPIIIHTIL